MKIKQLLCFFILLLLSSSGILIAQDFELDWVNTFKETKRDYPPIFPKQGAANVQTASNGDIFVVGTFADTVDFDPSSNTYLAIGDHNNSAFLSRYSSDGALIWHKTLRANAFGTPNVEMTMVSLYIDEMDNLYVSGTFVGCADFDPSAGKAEICATHILINPYVAKYDANGNYIWAFAAKNAEPHTPSNAYMSYQINIDEVHNAVYLMNQFLDSVIVGPKTHYSNGANDLVLTKLDLDGNYIWSKQIGSQGVEFNGGIATDQNGDIVYVGYYDDTLDVDPNAAVTEIICPVVGNSNMYISKLTASGQFVWAKTLLSQTHQSHAGEDVFYLGGYYAKIQLDSSNQIYLTSPFSGEIDLDPSSAVRSINSEGSYDLFLAKYTDKGNYIWSKQIVANGNESISESSARISTMKLYNEKVFLTGMMLDTMDFNSGNANGYYTGVKYSGFITALDLNGTYQWTYVIKNHQNGPGARNTGILRTISFDTYDRMYAVGEFSGTTDFDMDGDTLTNSQNGSWDMYIARFKNRFVGIEETAAQSEMNFILFPNPANNLVYLNWEANSTNQNTELRITDALGKVILTQRIASNKVQLDVSVYPKGLYLVQVNRGEKTEVRKLVVR